tara:strand:- start:9 stop:254 length:246 start_codon:yes stop_codon:yes gene_type:complete
MNRIAFMFDFYCGSSSVGRASASQAGGRGFKSRLPLFLGRVAKWFKAWACKAYIRRFESDRALILRIIKKGGLAQLDRALD